MNFGSEDFLDDGGLDINITPLIDIVFLLLIFFMVTTTFDQTRSLPVKLPSSSTSAVEVAPKNFTVSISATGEIEMDGEMVSLDALAEKLKAIITEGVESSLIVRADKTVGHGIVVAVLDRAKQSGIQKVAIATLAE